MIMYFILLFIPSIFAILEINRISTAKPIFFLMFLFFTIVVGLRDKVGMDWSNYLQIYYSFIDNELNFEQLTSEPSFNLINMVAKSTSLGINFVNFVHALIFIGGVFYFCVKGTSEYFLAVAIATPYLIIVIGMSGIRQAAAIGIFMYAVAIWSETTTLKKVALIFLAATFHTSAILLLVLIVLDRKGNPIKVFLTSALALAIGLYIMSANQEYYIRSYVEENLESPGAIAHSLLIAVPAILFILYKEKFILYGIYKKIYFNISLMVLAIFPMLSISSTGTDRFLLYFSCIQLYVFASLAQIFQSSLIRIFIILINSVILYVWLVHANNSEAWLPYNTCLLSVTGCFNP